MKGLRRASVCPSALYHEWCEDEPHQVRVDCAVSADVVVSAMIWVHAEAIGPHSEAGKVELVRESYSSER